MATSVLTANYVNASDVFFGQQLAWNGFSNCEPDCSWGNNNRTLVSREFLIDALESIEEESAEETCQIEKVVVSLKGLPDDVYIDLEN